MLTARVTELSKEIMVEIVQGRRQRMLLTHVRMLELKDEEINLLKDQKETEIWLTGLKRSRDECEEERARVEVMMEGHQEFLRTPEGP